MRKVNLPNNFTKPDFSELAESEDNLALKVRYIALSYLQAGKTVLETAELVGRSSRMVHRWISQYRDFGLDGLKDKPGRGRKTQLPVEREDEFKSKILALQRQSVGKLKGRSIQKLLKDDFDIDCTLSTVYNILSRLNLTVHYNIQNRINLHRQNLAESQSMSSNIMKNSRINHSD
ncbi:MAG TPA: helix-turn-helix domain-containing protein [Burkholderiales bacterium]|mgnify:CR=1 FL=1|jgi:transposase|nr:helix-turn-helix domain-containing protein [Burkholderiales bacterium]